MGGIREPRVALRFRPMRWAVVVVVAGACAVPQRNVGGTLIGLDPALGSVSLNLNNDQGVTLLSDGAFKFPRPVDEGAPFEVTLTAVPERQTCVVQGGVGKVGTTGVTTVLVKCGRKSYGVGGTLSGVDRAGLTLIERTSGQTSTPGIGQTTFAFGRPLPFGETYVVQVDTRPSGRSCVVDGGVGTIGGTVSSVVVDCAPQRFVLSGEVEGLDAGVVVLAEAATAQQRIVDGSGPFAFAGLIEWGTVVDVTVAQQPAAAFCWVDGGTFEMRQPRTVLVSCN